MTAFNLSKTGLLQKIMLIDNLIYEDQINILLFEKR